MVCSIGYAVSVMCSDNPLVYITEIGSRDGSLQTKIFLSSEVIQTIRNIHWLLVNVLT